MYQLHSLIFNATYLRNFTFCDDHIVGSGLRIITHLTFDAHFNHPIINAIWYGVTHLTFGTYFNRPISAIPSNVSDLIFGENFNQSIINDIPDNFAHSIFEKNFINQFPQKYSNVVEYCQFHR